MVFGAKPFMSRSAPHRALGMEPVRPTSVRRSLFSLGKSPIQEGIVPCIFVIEDMSRASNDCRLQRDVGSDPLNAFLSTMSLERLGRLETSGKGPVKKLWPTRRHEWRVERKQIFDPQQERTNIEMIQDRRPKQAWWNFSIE